MWEEWLKKYQEIINKKETALEKYKENVFDKMTEEQKLKTMYNMSKKLHEIEKNMKRKEKNHARNRSWRICKN